MYDPLQTIPSPRQLLRLDGELDKTSVERAFFSAMTTHRVPANQAKIAYEFLGSPEGELALAQACMYLATAPKSNALYCALGGTMDAIKQHGSLPVPMHIRNAPTGLMKDLGYGKGYQYDHNSDDHFSGQECLPEKLLGEEFYRPSTFGFEREIQKRLDWWKGLKEKSKE